MRVLENIGMILADTSRSKIYLAQMIISKLLPNSLIVLKNLSDRCLPGQLHNDCAEYTDHSFSQLFSLEVDQIYKRIINIPLEEILRYITRPYVIINEVNINSQDVVSHLKASPEEVFIFSGYGGQIVSPMVLNEKKLLHVHGGYLPKFKGSTTNYFSLLEEDAMGATSFFLTEKLDDGRILCRKKFPPPSDKLDIDHLTDSIIRAKVMVETLENYRNIGEWKFIDVNNEGATIYYIIHPLLKHLAILRKN